MLEVYTLPPGLVTTVQKFLCESKRHIHFKFSNPKLGTLRCASKIQHISHQQYDD